MDIDWNKPVETCEDPRHPERVIVLFDASHKPTACKIGSAYHGMPDLEGCIKFGAYTYRLRNVSPKPRKREGWMYVGKTDAAILMNTYVYASEDIARERHPGGCPGYQLIRIEWEEVP